MPNVQLKVPPDVKPLFANEVSVNVTMKVNVDKDSKGKEKARKWGAVEVLFVDKNTQNIISRIVLDPITAKALGRMLGESTDKLFKELAKKGVPAAAKKQMSAAKKGKKKGSASMEYIG